MFEELEKEQREEQEERKKLLRITVIIVSVLVVVGAIVFMASRGHSKATQAAQPLAAAANQAAADPMHDLKIVRALMGKDPTGLRVMWSVQMKNISAVYTYSDIQYEARFIGPDGRTREANRDTIKTSIGPGEEQKIPQFIDGIFDAGASTYEFVVLGATSSKQ